MFLSSPIQMSTCLNIYPLKMNALNGLPVLPGQPVPEQCDRQLVLDQGQWTVAAL